MPSIDIIVPCYNEAKRLNADSFINFANSHPGTRFIFINDGSTDATGTILEYILSKTDSAIAINTGANKGKGEAVRQGMWKALELNSDYIGYIDADLSTSLEEFYSLMVLAEQKNADLVFGSRIKKMDTRITRSASRHYIGRVIATIIDKRFKLGVYDTQCGAKVFRSGVLIKEIIKPFQTKWFFDVELLLRLKNHVAGLKAYEIPLSVWTNVKNSKISYAAFPEVIKELWVLSKNY